MMQLRIIFLLIPLSLATGVEAADLLTIYRLAQSNDPTLQSAKESQLAAIEALPQARAQFFPTVQAQSTHTAYNTATNNLSAIPPNTSTRTHYNQTTYGLSLKQPIFYYQQWVQLSKASEQVKGANAAFAAAEQDLIVRTVQRYFGVLKAFDALKFSTAQRKAFAKFLEQTEQRYKVGLIANTDVQIAKAQYDSAYAQEIAAENDLSNKKEILREITGEPIDHFAFLRTVLALKSPEPDKVEDWVAQAFEHNYALQAQQFSVNAARLDIRLQQGGHLPSLNINSNITHKNDSPYDPGNRTGQVGLAVSMPIFSGGSVRSETRQAVHLYEKNKKDWETAHRQTESSTRQAFRGVLTQISQASALNQAIVSNKSALDATEAAFNVGTRTIVDVLNAQTNLIQAEKDYANARYDYIIQSIQLKQAAGILNPEDVQHINAWLTQET